MSPSSGSFGDITPTPPAIKVYTRANWQSGIIDNSLLSFTSGSDFSWGIFKFHLENTNSDNYIGVSILDTDNSELANLGEFNTDGDKEVALTDYVAVGSNDIKIKFSIVQLDQQVVISDPELLPLAKW